MNQEMIKYIIEAALMVSEKPLSVAHLAALFEKDVEQMDHTVIRNALEKLQEDYKDRGIELKEVASGYRIQVQSKYADWVNRLFDERPPRYSRALLETLAIIAYRQPLTRAEIEDVRGVSVNSSIIKTLMEREWIRVVGHRNVPGKPELLATTKEFLDYFNLKKLSDLPTLTEIKELNQINPDLFDALKIPRTQDEEVSDDGKQYAFDTSVNDSEPSTGDPAILDNDKIIPFTH